MAIHELPLRLKFIVYYGCALTSTLLQSIKFLAIAQCSIDCSNYDASSNQI